MYADLLIHNGKCLTHKAEARCDWLALKGDRIVALGEGDSYRRELAGWEEAIDARGGSVLPGFYDSSMHFVQTAVNKKRLDLSAATCFDDIGDMIRAEREKHPGALIAGYGLDELNLREKKLPDRHVLDHFCADAPVWLSRVEYHTSILNTYSLLHYKIPYTLQGIELDHNKMPTGVFRLFANAKLREDILNDLTGSYRLEAAKALVPELLRQGITTINAMEGGFTFSNLDAEFVHMNAGALPLDIHLFYQTTDIGKIQQMQLGRIGGSLFVDGAFGSRNAALREDYTDDPGNRGRLYYTPDEMNEFVLACYQNNLQLSVHVIGERAIDMVLEAHRRAARATGNTSLRHRLEHVELPSAENIQTAKELGILFSMQPAYEYQWGGPGKMYERRLGQRYQRTNPFRQIVDAGVVICGGSDSDVAPANPLLGIYAAANHPVAPHRIDVKSAIQLFTANGAYADFEEGFKGSLEKDYLADIVILSGDILAVPPQNILDLSVTHTIKSGNILYAGVGG